MFINLWYFFNIVYSFNSPVVKIAGVRIEIKKGNITNETVRCIVNTTNNQMNLTGGVFHTLQTRFSVSLLVFIYRYNFLCSLIDGLTHCFLLYMYMSFFFRSFRSHFQSSWSFCFSGVSKSWYVVNDLSIYSYTEGMKVYTTVYGNKYMDNPCRSGVSVWGGTVSKSQQGFLGMIIRCGSPGTYC